jgi:hypothetical protein
MRCKTPYLYVISGLHRGVTKIFLLLGCYAALVGSYRHFGTTYRSHLQRSSSRRRKMRQIGCPETAVTTNKHYVTSQKSENLDLASFRVHQPAVVHRSAMRYIQHTEHSMWDCVVSHVPMTSQRVSHMTLAFTACQVAGPTCTDASYVHGGKYSNEY